jgi:hypothetical protein
LPKHPFLKFSVYSSPQFWYTICMNQIIHSGGRLGYDSPPVFYGQILAHGTGLLPKSRIRLIGN